jgi:hypothetical protein
VVKKQPPVLPGPHDLGNGISNVTGGAFPDSQRIFCLDRVNQLNRFFKKDSVVNLSWNGQPES